jgi:hypothetical protein
MRSLHVAAASLLPFLAAGCVYSIHPVYDGQSMAFDSGLVGAWAEPGSSEQVQFAPMDDSCYAVTFIDEHGESGSFLGRLFWLPGSTILDVSPRELAEEGNETYRDHFVAVHSLLFLRRDGSRLVIRALDGERLEQYLETTPTVAGFTKVSGNIVLTGETGELRSLLESFLKTEEPLGEVETLVRLAPRG